MACQHEYRLIEGGYIRNWSTTISEDGTITASYSGESEFSDEGDEQYALECRTCLDVQPVPPGTTIEWS